ncbi:MAG: hypothetical protein PHT88_00035 [Candidatus Moranbacteria bacterium]|nr:hypothetical protein [Candidatus Moranbacteria bacterium]
MHFGQNSVDVFTDEKKRTVHIISGMSEHKKSCISMSSDDYSAFILGAAAQMKSSHT